MLSAPLARDIAGESTTLLVVIVMAGGGFRLYQYLRDDQRFDSADASRRLDRERRNVAILLEYAAKLRAKLPADDDVEPWPELVPEVEDDELDDGRHHRHR